MSHDMIDREFWLKDHDIPLNTNNLTMMAVHGSLCLALRHPQFRGKSRSLVIAFVKSLGEWLVTEGIMTQERLAEAQEQEAEEGSSDLL